MKNYSHTLVGLLWRTYTILICGAVIASPDPLEQSNPDTLSPEISQLASEAYSLLSDLPNIGIDKAKGEIEQLITSANKLMTNDGAWETQLSLALREGIAHSLIYEMYRSEAMRLGINLEGQPAPIPFKKKNFLELWNANLPNNLQVLARTRKGNDVIVKQLSAKQMDNETIADGYKLREINDEVHDRYSKLKNQAHAYNLHHGKMSADEKFVQSLVVLQSLRDLDNIVQIYDKSGLFKDYTELRAAIDADLHGSHKKRMDDGMRASSLKVMSTFSKYCSPSEEMYLNQQAMLLGSYLENTANLPTQVRIHLDRRKREADSSDAAGNNK